MSTYRERREARAERLKGWAEKREREAGQVFRDHERYRGCHAFNFQPGHIPERARVIAREDRAHESLRTAEGMAERAAGIEAQLATSIYSDDHDAAERLREKIAGLEAERDQIKAYNASCRKAAKAGGSGDLSLLSEKNRADLLSTAKCAGYMIGKGGAAPSYWLTNLGGNIRRLKGRLDDIESGRAERRASRDRTITARYGGTCSDCGAPIERGQQIRYSKAAGARCADCGEEE